MLRSAAAWPTEEDSQSVEHLELRRSSLLIRSTGVAQNASDLADDSAKLYERMVQLQIYMNAVYLQQLDFKPGVDFLTQAATDHDATVNRWTTMGEEADAGPARIDTSMQKVQDRLFVIVTEEEKAHEYMRDL